MGLRDAEPPHYPRENEVAGLDQWSGDELKSRHGDPNKDEGDSCAFTKGGIVEADEEIFFVAGSLAFAFEGRWTIAVIFFVFDDSEKLGRGTEGLEDCPCGCDIERHDEKSDGRMAQQDAEDVKSEMSVVGQGEGVYNSIVPYNGQAKRNKTDE